MNEEIQRRIERCKREGFGSQEEYDKELNNLIEIQRGKTMKQPKRFILKKVWEIKEADWFCFHLDLTIIYCLYFILVVSTTLIGRLGFVILGFIVSYIFFGKYPYRYKTILEETKE